MKQVTVRYLRIILAIAFLALVGLDFGRIVDAANRPESSEINPASQERVPLDNKEALSPIWPQSIHQWSQHISALSSVYGLDQDFIAAVIKAESNGYQEVISGQGAVGLMGVMPTGPGLEWRPSAEELANPAVNLRWGVSILAEIVRQSGGDLYAALAAYSGGWDQVSSRVPQEYAADILNDYGRAVAARSGVSPEIATEWTIAIEMKHGHVPPEKLLVLGNQPSSGLETLGEHLIYDYTDQNGQTYHVRGYAVPLALVVPPLSESGFFGSSDTLEPELMRQSGSNDVKNSGSNSNSGVLIACLPSLNRLRGLNSTRWFAPSSCPSWHR
jgi:hypothetical protein